MSCRLIALLLCMPKPKELAKMLLLFSTRYFYVWLAVSDVMMWTGRMVKVVAVIVASEWVSEWGCRCEPFWWRFGGMESQQNDIGTTDGEPYRITIRHTSKPRIDYFLPFTFSTTNHLLLLLFCWSFSRFSPSSINPAASQPFFLIIPFTRRYP